VCTIPFCISARRPRRISVCEDVTTKERYHGGAERQGTVEQKVSLGKDVRVEGDERGHSRYGGREGGTWQSKAYRQKKTKFKE
jgi:hypothetical protein